jgi:hypothetical protein
MPMPVILSEPTAQVVILSSNGREAYHVTHFKGKRNDWECECATWRGTRRPCKHMDLAKKALRSKERLPGVVDVWKGLDWK